MPAGIARFPGGAVVEIARFVPPPMMAEINPIASVAIAMDRGIDVEFAAIEIVQVRRRHEGNDFGGDWN